MPSKREAVRPTSTSKGKDPGTPTQAFRELSAFEDYVAHGTTKDGPAQPTYSSWWVLPLCLVAGLLILAGIVLAAVQASAQVSAMTSL